MAELPKNFPWRPGMLAIVPSGAQMRLYMGDHGVLCAQDEVGPGFMSGAAESLTIFGGVPDPNDPATLGALLGVARDRFPGAHAEPNGAAEWDGVDEAERANWWAVYAPGGPRLATGSTEFDALVNTLRMMEAGDV